MPLGQASQIIPSSDSEDLKDSENTSPNSTEVNEVQEGNPREQKLGTTNTKLKVSFQGWNGVAIWKWIASDDTCGICRVSFDGCCPDCKLPGDDCPVVWGVCTHCFHIHCIMKWINQEQAQQLCPMCRQEWKFKE